MEGEAINQIINSNLNPVIPMNLYNSFLSLFFAGIYGWLISKSYKFASISLSGGRQINSSLIPLTLIVCVIISIVKSSLALSLGLVGALSIVRFRTPIKDPEDLTYLFLAIVTGLGFGANQDLYTSLGISFILIVLTLRTKFYKRRKRKIQSGSEYNLSISWESKEEIKISNIIESIYDFSEKITFIRLEKLKIYNSLILQIELSNISNIESLLTNVNAINKSINIEIYSSEIDY